MSGMTDGPLISSLELFDHSLFELFQDYWVHFHHPHLRYFWWWKITCPKSKDLLEKIG